MKIIQLTADYYEETASIAIIKKRRTPSTRSYPLLRVFWKKLNQARAAELQSVCRYLLLTLGVSLAPSPISASPSLLECRILSRFDVWVGGREGCSRERERKKEKIESISICLGDAVTGVPSGYPTMGPFLLSMGDRCHAVMTEKPLLPTSQWAPGACRLISASSIHCTFKKCFFFVFLFFFF